jgi:DNA-binding CsgD family transcriptional regulator
MKNSMMPPFETMCLRWIAKGKTLAETAFLMGKRLAEIEQCLQSAAAMLDAASIEEAVLKASRHHPRQD